MMDVKTANSRCAVDGARGIGCWGVKLLDVS